MKFSQKAKYIIFGFFGATGLVLLAAKAAVTIPLIFKEGDVISASVMNALFARVNDATSGFVDVSELDGPWSCTTYSTNSVGCSPAGALLYQKTGTMTFVASSRTFAYSGTGDPRGCFAAAYQTTGNYDVQGGFLVTDYGVYEAKKKSATEFLWTLNSANPPNGYTVCTKQNAPPNPVNNLTASISGTSATLTWTPQGTDQTGFKVQREAAGATTWTDVATAAASATSYTDSALAPGTYLYRVLATNGSGDSISSSEVQVVI
jgi:hypothetical protein